jgi:hypothetical protein
MGTLDDAIRQHLELKRQKGASNEEIEQKEAEAFGRGATAPQPPPPQDAPPSESPPALPPETFEDELDLAEPDEVLPEDSLQPNGTMPPEKSESELRADELAIGEPGLEDRASELDREPEPWVEEAEDAEDEAPAEDLLEETPDFLEETPEHDRLWFEQKPPKDFDF